MYLFDDKFPFLILLTRLISFGIRPTDKSFASLTEYITNRMHTCYEQPIFWWSFSDIDALIEEVSPSCVEKETITLGWID
jgi:hypothetical protein